MTNGRTVSNVVEDLVRSTVQAGGDVAVVAREAAEGTVLGAQQARVNALDAVAVAAGAAVKAAADSGADVAAAARGAVQGAIWGAKDLGVDPSETASAAAHGALHAAGALGGTADVERAVSGVIDGVSVKPEEPSHR